MLNSSAVSGHFRRGLDNESTRTLAQYPGSEDSGRLRSSWAHGFIILVGLYAGTYH